MKLYLWGTGCGAGEAIEKGIPLDMVAGFVDSHPFSPDFLGKPVILPEVLKDCSPDLIIVTARHVSQISEQCRRLDIPEEKLLYLKDHHILKDRNAACCCAAELLGEPLLRKLLPRQCVVTVPESLQSAALGNDPVRLGTLELITRRLEKIPGAAAELGVYKGAFSSVINGLLPERSLYLFDSFEGFRPEEGQREKEQNTCSDAFLNAHRNTAMDLVMKAMPYPEQVILMPGYFPDSLRGLEQQFCLVSLDADFYETTLEGLRYFWPRISPGGYLMVHDWGSSRLTGVRRAVADYERERGCFLPSVPIPDIGSSLIIQKTEN